MPLDTATADWAAISRAISLPAMMQGADASLTLELGQRSVGWSIAGQRQERPGPALDLTGATIQLRAIPQPERATAMETMQLWHMTAAQVSRSGVLRFGAPYFLIDGVIDAPATDGKVTFTLPKAKLDAEGRFLARPEVTTAAGLLLIPRLLKFVLVGGGY